MGLAIAVPAGAEPAKQGWEAAGAARLVLAVLPGASPTHGTSSPGSLGQERCSHPGCTQRSIFLSAQPGDAGALTTQQRLLAATRLSPSWRWGGPYLAASSRCEGPGPGSTEPPSLLEQPRCCCCWRLRKEASEASAGSQSPATAGRRRGTTASRCSARMHGSAGSGSGRKMGAGAVRGGRTQEDALCSVTEPVGTSPSPQL